MLDGDVEYGIYMYPLCHLLPLLLSFSKPQINSSACGLKKIKYLFFFKVFSVILSKITV